MGRRQKERAERKRAARPADRPGLSRRQHSQVLGSPRIDFARWVPSAGSDTGGSAPDGYELLYSVPTTELFQSPALQSA